MRLFFLGLCLLLGMPAHAGMFETIDNLFTFREDQKHRITPQRRLPPKIITTPYYDQREAAAWSHYYTRRDLVPVDYMNGTATKVMRPVASQRPPVRTQQLYMENQRRARQASRVYIGEPGTRPPQDGISTPQTTRVGPPLEGERFAREPGYTDRDNRYVARAPQAMNEPLTDAERLAQLPSLSDDKRPQPLPGDAARRSGGGTLPEQYEVQPGDTLSGIADKPRIYNDWALWPLIWDANRGTVRDPDLIRPRQQLGIPRDYTRPQAQDARQRAYRKGSDINYRDER